MGLKGQVCAVIVLCCGMTWRARAADTPDTLRAHLDALVARPGGLQAAQVASRAVATSYNVRAREQELAAAVAGVNQAIVNYIPRITALAKYDKLSDFAPPILGNVVVSPGSIGVVKSGDLLISDPLSIPTVTSQAIFQIGLAIPLLDYVLRIPALHMAAAHNRDAMALNARAARLQVGTDAQVIYYSWARAVLQVTIAEQALSQAQQHRGTVAHLFEVGAASKADTTRLEAQEASSELFLAKARDLASVLEDQVRTAMHEPVGVQYEIGEDLRVPLAVEVVPQAEGLIEEAWDKRLEVRAIEATCDGLRSQVLLNEAGYLPRVDGFASLQDSNPNPRYFPPLAGFKTTWDVGVQATWTFNDIAASTFATQSADARLKQVQAQRGSLRDGLRGEVMQALEGLRESDIAVQAAARGLNAAEESYRVRRDLFANGRASSVELTDAETDLTQARLQAVGAHIDQRIARVRLTHATGRDI